MADTWYLRTQDETFGPETKSRLIEWAQMGRIQPGQEISPDGENWKPATEMDFLDMRWSIDIGDGRPRGPFNKVAAQALLDSGRLPRGSRLVEVKPDVDEDDYAEPEAAEDDVVADDGRADRETSPRIIEKIVEKRVEVPVEKIVEKRVEVQDPELLARLDEMTARAEKLHSGLVAAETRAKTVEAQAEAARSEAEALVVAARSEADAAKQQAKAAEAETLALSDEIKRLPPNAQAAADTEAAVYALLQEEAEALAETLAVEKREAEESQKRWRMRSDRLLARRQELLRLIGTSADDMKRRALIDHPEDPRTTNLRRELDALRLLNEKAARETEMRLKDVTQRLREKTAEADRLRHQVADAAALTRQIQELRLRLQQREKELMEERQRSEAERRQHSMSQQTLLARLSALESSLPGRTNQSREAHAVKLAPWMGLKN